MAELKWTLEKIIEFIENENYEFIEYVSGKGKESRIKVWCKNPNHEPYEVTFNSFKGNKNRKGRRCARCSKWKGHSYEYIKKQFEKEGYTLISTEYKNAYTPMKVICSNKHEWKITYSNFQQGQRCPCCTKRDRYKEVKEYIESFGYKLLSTEYKNNKEKLSIVCPKGHHFDNMCFSSFKNDNQRCPLCNESKGEKRISEILDNFNILYIPQYKFDDCKFKYKLPFDFYLPQYNICIEYDGGQHFKIIEHFGGLDGFINTKIRDTIKNIYCKDNNIKLIRIPYWEFDNIEKILKELKIQ